MAIRIRISDAVIPGERSEVRSVTMQQPVTTARELIGCRIREEVERHNESPEEVFRGLVQPEESERILNGFRLQKRRPLSWEAQFDRACSSFERNGFLLIVDGKQVTELDTPIELEAESSVEFVKLVPLVGG